jgi:pimeloyl-ACP methyl ester carboxylesterase
VDLHLESARFHVDVEEGPGPLVLFLHGALASGQAFRGQRASFRGAFRMAFPDLRGHGRSSRGGADVPWESLSQEQMVRDVLALLDALSPGEPAHVVGVSMGGLLGAHAAARAPSRVRSLALVSAPGHLVPARQAFFASTPPDGLSAQTQRLSALWHGEPYWRDLARHLFRRFAQGEAFPERVPVARALVLHAEHDELLVPSEADAWAARIDGEVRVERPAGDHAFFADGRAGTMAANRALRAHLEGRI